MLNFDRKQVVSNYYTALLREAAWVHYNKNQEKVKGFY